MLAGCTTGAVAVTCAQPTDVVKVRFQANGALPAGARRYSGTVDAYCTIAREEGVRGLWRGRDGGELGRGLGRGGNGDTHLGCHHPPAQGRCPTSPATPSSTAASSSPTTSLRTRCCGRS